MGKRACANHRKFYFCISDVHMPKWQALHEVISPLNLSVNLNLLIDESNQHNLTVRIGALVSDLYSLCNDNIEQDVAFSIFVFATRLGVLNLL